MKKYTYWVQAVYLLQKKEYKISFPDFGPRIEPFCISYTGDLNDTSGKKELITSKAMEVLRIHIQQILDDDNYELPAHSKDFPIDIQFVNPKHIEKYEITVYLP